MSNPKEITVPQKPVRTFLHSDFILSDWNSVQPYYENLQNREITSADELFQWMKDRSEVESYLSENFAWRYIRQTCDTSNEKLIEDLQFFITDIQPQLIAVDNLLNQKALESPFIDQLSEKGMDITLRSMRKASEIFREENIPLQTESQSEERKYGAIAGAMTVTLDGEEMTLQKAADKLQSTSRIIREEAWRAINERRYQDHDSLDELFNTLVRLRDQIGKNAGFSNYRDYMFAAMGRFDYTPQDCFNFHDAVAEAVVPILNELASLRKKQLGVDTLRSWDLKVDTAGKNALIPFTDGNDLLQRTIRCFDKLDPFLGDCLRIMEKMEHLDLVSRKGKSPGGYNYPLAEIGVPFIFMNATSNLRDMVTLLHEGGHAVHSFVTRDLTLNSFKNTPSEVAELASMSMELLTMDHWDEFFANPDELRRAKRQHLESIIETLPWVATIDKFQHWIYENPTHTNEERVAAWTEIYSMFTDNVVDWNGLELYRNYIWQRQLHLYEVPFYYIEYAIAQLGAIGVWKKYRENKEKGLNGYLNALRLGYTATIGEVFEAANVPFDFSKEYITELMTFVKKELETL